MLDKPNDSNFVYNRSALPSIFGLRFVSKSNQVRYLKGRYDHNLLEYFQMKNAIPDLIQNCYHITLCPSLITYSHNMIQNNI